MTSWELRLGLGSGGALARVFAREGREGGRAGKQGTGGGRVRVLSLQGSKALFTTVTKAWVAYK